MAHAFNSDLLAGETDLDTARAAFGRIFFALDNPSLREAFGAHDTRANLSKRRSRRWGVVAVALATLALIIAASSDLYAPYGDTVMRAAAGVGAVAGITSVLIAVLGVMYRERKIRWLTDRLATERMRQFHFQHYATHARDILAGATAPALAAEYLDRRRIDFEKMRAGLLNRIEAEFRALVEADDPGDGLFHPAYTSAAPLPPLEAAAYDDAAVNEYFDAYETLRFRRQIDYCNYLLSEKRSIWSNAPARQAKIFAALAMGLIMFILLLDAAVFIGALADTGWIVNPYVQAAGICAAFLALSVRTLEEGFQVESEVARMRSYRQVINRIYVRFKNARALDDKIGAMMELEKSAYDEMVTFLKSHHDAEFVM